MTGKIVVKIDPDIEELIPGYIASKHSDLKLLSDALANNDYDTLRRTGHDLKGSGIGYGFDKISEIGRTIESAAKSGDGEAIRKSIEGLADYLSRIDVVYESNLT